eukprot:1931156-Lingulodinium_polyedra.AAC.1
MGRTPPSGFRNITLAKRAPTVGKAPMRSHAMRMAATAAVPPPENEAKHRGCHPSPEVPTPAGKLRAASPT